MLTKEQYRQLREKMEKHMMEDSYGLHTICSLYYDTDDYQIIRKSLSKPVFKEKLRLRSYGIPFADSDIYIELKQKFEGITYKRRILVKYKNAWEYLMNKTPMSAEDQIFKEIEWFTNQYDDLAPRVLLCYDRRALFGLEDNEFRITFDFNIRFRTEELDICNGDYGQQLISDENCLMEVKALGVLPFWFCQLLKELKIYPVSFSKYGTVYQKNILDQGEVLYGQ